MDENCSGETLNTTGWASGTNDRTKQWGNFTANYVYIVPVVYVQTAPKPVPNKSAPRLFRPPSPEEPVSNTHYYLKLGTFGHVRDWLGSEEKRFLPAISASTQP